MMRIVKRVGLLATLLGQLMLPVWAQTPEVNSNQPSATKVDAYGDPFTETKLLSANQRRLIVFRPSEQAANAKGVLSIFVDRQYHASLLSNSFSKLCADQSNYSLSAVFRETGAKTSQGQARRQELQTQLLPAQTKYIKVTSMPSGEMQLLEVSAAQAMEQLKLTREITHTLSRVSAGQACDEEGLTTAQGPTSTKADQALPSSPVKP